MDNANGPQSHQYAAGGSSKLSAPDSGENVKLDEAPLCYIQEPEDDQWTTDILLDETLTAIAYCQTPCKPPRLSQRKLRSVGPDENVGRCFVFLFWSRRTSGLSKWDPYTLEYRSILDWFVWFIGDQKPPWSGMNWHVQKQYDVKMRERMNLSHLNIHLQLTSHRVKILNST